MPTFRFNVYYKEIAVYQSDEFEFSIMIMMLNYLIEELYEFNDKFGDHIFKTSDFNYVIEEVF